MILQNISKAIREQNYYAVVLEFAIVIAGVVIGFQVNAWAEARAEHTLSHNYLIRLEAELSRDYDRAIDRVVTWREQVASGKRALAYVTAGEIDPADAWPLVVAFIYVGDINPYRSEQATFEELRSAGRLQLIQSEDIRTFFIQWAAAEESAGVKLGLALRDDYRWQVRQRTPPAVAEHVRTACIGLYRGSDATDVTACSPPLGFGEADALQLLDTYRNDAELVDDLRATTNALNEAALAYRSVATLIEPMVNLTRRELGVDPRNDVADRLGDAP